MRKTSFEGLLLGQNMGWRVWTLGAGKQDSGTKVPNAPSIRHEIKACALRARAFFC